MRNTKQENNVGNDHGRDSVAPQLRFFFFLSSLNSLNYWTLEPLKTPLAWLFIGKNHFGAVEARPGELMLSSEGMSLSRRAGCLGMKLFHVLGEPDPSLGELRSRKIQKRPFSPLPWYLFVFLIKILSDSLLCTVTGVKHRNSASKNQNINER